MNRDGIVQRLNEAATNAGHLNEAKERKRLHFIQVKLNFPKSVYRGLECELKER